MEHRLVEEAGAVEQKWKRGRSGGAEKSGRGNG